MPEKQIHEVTRQAKDFYEKGVASIERQAHDAAIHFLTEALSLEPGFLKARQTLRLAQIQKLKQGGAMSKMFGSVAGSASLASAMASIKKNPAKAIEAAEKALNSNPYNAQALKILAEAAIAMDMPHTAMHAYETAREGNPKNIPIILSLGKIYQTLRHTDKAIECYDMIRKIDPDNIEAQEGLKNATANQAMIKGGWETARDEDSSYRDLIANEEEAVSLENANRMVMGDEVVRSQMAEVYQLTQQEPTNISHWKKLGDLSLRIDQYDYAIQYYEHAFALSNQSDGTLENLVSTTKVKKFESELKQKEEALAQNPEDATLQQEFQTLQEQYQGIVLAECESRSRKYPNDLDIRYELARHYYRAGQIDKALKEFQAALSNPKTKVPCTHWLGLCFREKGMLDMAVQRMKSAAEMSTLMDSSKKEILYNLGTTYEQMGKKDLAIEQYKVIYDADIGYRDVSQKIEEYYRNQSAT